MATVATVEHIEACPVAGCRRHARRLVCELHAGLVPFDLKRRELTAWMRYEREVQRAGTLRHDRVRLAGVIWRTVRAEVLAAIARREETLLAILNATDAASPTTHTT